MDQPISALSPEAKLGKLSEYDFIFLIDKSGSMTEEDMPGNKSRWDACQETVGAIAREINKIDSDGLGLVMFSGTGITAADGVKPADIATAFATNRPSGSTPLAEGLTAALKLAGKSAKKDFILVVTDGVPDDQAAALKVIRDQANSQTTDDELTILFMQIGYNAQASAYLKTLDDNIPGAKFDIVDAKTMAEVEAFPSAVDLILHAIND